MFSVEKILVRREMEAFPLDSLVADCGGILGLFLGFNFLMIWEWIMDFLMFYKSINEIYNIIKNPFPDHQKVES